MSASSLFRLGLVLAASLLPSWAFAWDWPFDTAEAYETGAFSSSTEAGLLPGVFFALQHKEVHPVHQGEIVYYSKTSPRRLSNLYGSPQNMVLLAHPNGMRSLYVGLENLNAFGGDSYVQKDTLAFYSNLAKSDQDALRFRWHVSEGAVLGTNQEFLFLGIFDPLESAIINPWSVLPADPGLPGVNFLSFRVREPGTGEFMLGSYLMELPWPKIELSVSYRDPWASTQNGESRPSAAQPRLPRGTTLVRGEVKMEGKLLAAMDLRTMQALSAPARRVMVDERHKVLDLNRSGVNTINIGVIPLKEGKNPLDLVLINAAGNRQIYRIWLRFKPAQTVGVP